MLIQKLETTSTTTSNNYNGLDSDKLASYGEEYAIDNVNKMESKYKLQIK